MAIHLILLILKYYKMHEEVNEPIKVFMSKTQRDLKLWFTHEARATELLNDYKGLQKQLQKGLPQQKLMVQLGNGVHSKAKRINQKIILRMKEDLYVEVTFEEALPILKILIGFYEERVEVCKGQACKVMAAMREMDQLISNFQGTL